MNPNSFSNPNNPVTKAMTVNLRNLIEKLPAPFNEEKYKDLLVGSAAMAFMGSASVLLPATIDEELVPRIGGQVDVRFMNNLLATVLRLAADHVEQGTEDFLRMYPQGEKGNS